MRFNYKYAVGPSNEKIKLNYCKFVEKGKLVVYEITIYKYQVNGIQYDISSIQKTLLKMGFVPEIYNGKIYTVPGFDKLTFVDEEYFDSAHDDITEKTMNTTLSIYFMAKNKLDGRSWHNTQLKRDAILAAQSAV